jgi:hypothetical protein
MLNLQGSPDMESVSRIFGKLDAADRPISAEQLACSAWPAAVGKKIAVRTRAAKLVRTRLVIEVEDKIWQRNLFILSRQILGNLDKRLGPGVVDDLEFRIVPKRIAPQRAESSLFTDEADRIADPIMRHIYKAARHKETA